MADTPAPSNWKVAQGVILISLIAFAAFVAAGLGWHAGVALARVIGI